MKAAVVTLVVLVGFIAIAVGGILGLAVVVACCCGYYILVHQQATRFHEGVAPTVHAAFLYRVASRADRDLLSQKAWALLRSDAFRTSTERLALSAQNNAENAQRTYTELVVFIQVGVLIHSLVPELASERLPSGVVESQEPPASARA
jgi:hypothetical protein